MELLLKESVDKLGRVGDVVQVRKGYARNYLLPKGLATNVTQANLKLIEKEKIKMELEMKVNRERLQGILKNISNASCTISVKANKEGKLFGSVTSVHIAEALAGQGYPVTKDMIKLDSPIKVCGEYDVPIALDMEMQTQCKVSVVVGEEGVA
ncbi:MAG: 50S ribosomal protein L9 [Candidatus Brocadiaceae bacterium]|nr:50S ribosomal protein L9 [Candidatus Brocadiaceae bacterium]